jgi:hypothetical protein
VSQGEFLRFLQAAGSSPALLARYAPMDMPRMLFHARNDGFAFTLDDVGPLVGRLEAGVVLDKDNEPFDGASSLWRLMWGRRYLDYLVRHVVSRFTDEELAQAVPVDETRREAS